MGEWGGKGGGGVLVVVVLVVVWCGGASGTIETLHYDNSADYLLVIEKLGESPHHLSLEQATASSS